MNIIAVVVTYNRLPLLKRTVAALRAQTRQLGEIIVVNNGSTDGTGEWLAGQMGLHVVEQANEGGSGGFYTGIKEACERGAEAVWCMDDDVFPQSECLEKLLKVQAAHPEAGILAPRRLQNGKVFCHDFTAYNLTNPFASMYRGKLAKQSVTEPTAVAGTAFEGPLIMRPVIDKIGLPNRDLFIFCDDTDYCLRAHLAGFSLIYVPDALMDKELFFADDTWAEREQKKKWKRFYQIRNSTYLNHRYGRNFGVRYLRGLIGVGGYILTAALTAPFSKGWAYADIPRLWQAYRDGISERLGKY